MHNAQSKHAARSSPYLTDSSSSGAEQDRRSTRPGELAAAMAPPPPASPDAGAVSGWRRWGWGAAAVGSLEAGPFSSASLLPEDCGHSPRRVLSWLGSRLVRRDVRSARKRVSCRRTGLGRTAAQTGESGAPIPNSCALSSSCIDRSASRSSESVPPKGTKHSSGLFSKIRSRTSIRSRAGRRICSLVEFSEHLQDSM
jgi:hypothetical protein